MNRKYYIDLTGEVSDEDDFITPPPKKNKIIDLTEDGSPPVPPTPGSDIFEKAFIDLTGNCEESSPPVPPTPSSDTTA